MKGYQVALILIVFFALGMFLSQKAFAGEKTGGSLTTDPTENPDELVGKVDLWCENGKYYKRTSTKVYGQPLMEELTRAQFDGFVSQGISYSGCKVDDKGNITA